MSARLVLTSWVAVLVALPAFGEVSKLVDVRGDTTIEDHYVVFTQRSTGGRGSSDAFVVAGMGKSDRELSGGASYGLYTAEDGVRHGTISQETIGKVRGATGDKEATSLILKVDHEQFMAVTKVLKEWAAKDDLKGSPDFITMDITEAAVKRIGIKQPYRSGLSGGNTRSYYADLYTITREKK